ncbi:MAG: hypothetical protein AAF589_00260 [Planctomycetota bacterium]
MARPSAGRLLLLIHAVELDSIAAAVPKEGGEVLLRALRHTCLASAALTLGVAPADGADKWRASVFGKLAVRGDAARAVGDGRVLRVDWQEVPLRQVVRSLGLQFSFTIHVDRRLDPNTPLTVRAEGDVEALLAAVAAAHNAANEQAWGVSELAGALYLGPRQSAEELSTLHARARRRVNRLAPSARRVFLADTDVAWDRLADAREVVQRAAARLPAGVVNAELLPHDLWAAGSERRAPLTAQLTLLLIGFDLDWAPSATGDGVVVAPIRRPVRITAEHPVGVADPRADDLRLSAGANLQKAGRAWTLRGRVEDHRRLSRALAGAPPALKPASAVAAASGFANKRLTMKVTQQPTLAVLAKIAAALGLVLDPRVSEEAAATRVSFAAENETLEQVLRRISGQASLALRLDGKRLLVEPLAEGRRGVSVEGSQTK